MRRSVISFPGAQPTAEALACRVRELATRSENIDFAQPHFREQLAKRGITMSQVLVVLRTGKPKGKPVLDQYGDWRVKMIARASGRIVRVPVAICGNKITPITAY